jgi:TonB family protein
MALLICERLLIHKISAQFLYKMWWLIPSILLLLSLPSELKPLSNNAMQYMTITPTQLPIAETWLLSWQVMYTTGTITLLLIMLWQHRHFHKKLTLQLTDTTYRGHPLYLSTQVNSPMVVGLIKARIVFPANYTQRFDPESLSFMFEHEYTHIRRLDNLWNLGFFLLCSVTWFNPLIWLGYQSFRRVQELACDEFILKNKPNHQHMHYAKTLINCVEHHNKRHFAYAYYGDKNTMLQRLNHIKNTAQPSKVAQTLLITCALTSISTLAITKDSPTEKVKATHSVKPIMRIEPKYPIEAANNGISGYVQLAYTIDERGHTNNIKVIEASPKNTFEKNAVTALRQWQYTASSNPKKIHRIQLDFRINEDATNTPQNGQFERLDVSH